jgi:molecular chaperone DnaJ
LANGKSPSRYLPGWTRDRDCASPARERQDFSEALGAEIKVPTIDGWERLQIPEGTQTGTIFRLRSKGIPRLRGHGRGDQIVSVTVVTPKRLSKEQRKLFNQLQGVTPPITVDPEAPEKDKSFIEKLFG